MKILLVDDEKDTEFLFRSFFRKELNDGIYEFYFKENGQEALDLFKENEMNLILVDLNMPVMGGTDLIKAIKDIKPNQDIVIITAYDNKENRDFSNKYDGVGFLAKPVDFDELRDILSVYFKKYS